MPDVDLTYHVGTCSVGVGDTAVVGVGTLWSQSANVRQWDLISIDGGPLVPIVASAVDDTHITIPAWAGAVKAGVSYVIYQVSPLRFVGGQAMADVDNMLALLNTDGWYRYVNPAFAGPTEQGITANEGQFALKYTTGQLWIMTSGAWVLVGTFKPFGIAAPYDNAKTYTLNDVATLSGSSYVFINPTPSAGHSPPNATYWQVLAAKGDTGPAFLKPIVPWVTATAYVTGPPASYVSINGSSYECLTAHTSGTFATDLAAGKWGLVAQAAPTFGGTSVTSWLIGTGSKPFATQANLAYQNGARVRASSAANTSNWMEGLATYSGTTLTIAVAKISGSGTAADWNFNVVGEPGAGDMSSSNFASEYVGHEAAVRSNIKVDVATQSKSADYTIVAADYGSLLLLSGSHTLSFTAAATLGDKFKFRIRNSNSLTGLWTLDPNSTETIDGKTTLTLGIGEEMDIYCDGAAFWTNASRGKLVELQRNILSATGLSDFNFAAGIPTDFDRIEFEFVNILASTNDTFMFLRVKTTASLTLQTGSVYLWSGRAQEQGGGIDHGTGIDISLNTVIPLAIPAVAGQMMGNSGGYVLGGSLKISSPQSAGVFQPMEASTAYLRSDGISSVKWDMSGQYMGGVALTGFSFAMNGPSNFASGTIIMRGIRN